MHLVKKKTPIAYLMKFIRKHILSSWTNQSLGEHMWLNNEPITIQQNQQENIFKHNYVDNRWNVNMS